MEPHHQIIDPVIGLVALPYARRLKPDIAIIVSTDTQHNVEMPMATGSRSDSHSSTETL
jgi:hypothetical protein